MATTKRRAKGKTERGKRKAASRRRAKRTEAKRTRAKRVANLPRSPRGKAGPVNEWFELRPSSIQGLGAFAITDIPKGTRLIEYSGERISNKLADERYDDDAMRRHHTFLFILTSRTVIDAAYGGNESRFINHSCDPNCETLIERGHIWISSIKSIRAGEEITYDYMYDDDPKYTAKDYRFYACHCGAANCRGTIVKTRRKWR
jgi:SET domain-containing protein